MKTLFVGLFLAVSASFASASTSFFYTSGPQSYVGQGQTELVSSDEFMTGIYSPYAEAGFPVTEMVEFNFTTNPYTSRRFRIAFSVPADEVFEVGRVYVATRFPFQADDCAGLNFTSGSRGNNKLDGLFKVLEYSVADGVVVSAAIDFWQFDEGFTSWWSFGSIRHNSSVPIATVPYDLTAVPEPSTYSAILGTLCLGFALARRKVRPTNSVSVG
jgi:hypothetical protein